MHHVADIGGAKAVLRLIYGEKADLTRGYFDLLDWMPDPQPLTHYLAEGSFATAYQGLNEHLASMSLQGIADKEQEVLQKHLRLWRQGLVDFTATRFSSIAGNLQAAGVNFYFVYPHIQVVRDAIDRVVAQIRLRDLRVNQTSAIYVTPKQGRGAQEAGKAGLDALEALLTKFNKAHMGVNGGGYSFFVNEREELIGPLDKKPLVLSNRASPYVREISQSTGLSSLTVQKILSVMDAMGTDGLSPQDLAMALSITVRSANRFIRQLVQSELAVVQYERQNASRGRPERVYKLLLDPHAADPYSKTGLGLDSTIWIPAHR